MLDMGFIPDIERIFKLTPFTRQTLFFSATMPPEITRLTQEFLHNPIRVEASAPATSAATVTQRLCSLKPSKKENADKEKRQLLSALLRAEGEGLKNAIVFCNRKRDIGAVHKSLLKRGFNAGALHGDLDQSVRTATLGGFRDGAIQILVASDVAARGLDIPSVSHVVNFDVPIHSEDYVHRIGRTGRAGRTGTALMIALPHEAKHVDKIEALIGKPVEPMPLPEGFDVAAGSFGDEGESLPPARDRRPAAPPRAPKEVRPEAPAARAPQPSQPPRAPQREQAKEPARPQPRDHGRGRDRREGGQPVVGLGDHVPAFLLREVPVRKPSRRDTDDDAEAAA
jgi:superfamily II DNA/RNA helicase